jgi:hypothetical protein
MRKQQHENETLEIEMPKRKIADDPFQATYLPTDFRPWKRHKRKPWIEKPRRCNMIHKMKVARPIS